MHHLPEHINQDITRKQSKTKDPTVIKTGAKEIMLVLVPNKVLNAQG